MPIENELKYVLPLDFDASNLHGWDKHDIRQGYLDDGPRIRQIDASYLFTYKKWVSDARELVEIETDLSREDFTLLWPLCVQRVQKTRYVKVIGEAEWVVDLLRNAEDEVYFVMAEVEMPRHTASPDGIPAEIEAHILHAVPSDDNAFTNKKLSNPDYAARQYEKVT